MSCLRQILGVTRRDRSRNDAPPLKETAHCWEADTMEPPAMVRPCVLHGRLPSAKMPSMGRAPRRLVLSAQRTQETMERPGCCQRLDASHQAPLP